MQVQVMYMKYRLALPWVMRLKKHATSMKERTTKAQKSNVGIHTGCKIHHLTFSLIIEHECHYTINSIKSQYRAILVNLFCAEYTK